MIDYYISTKIVPLIAFINLSLILIFLYLSFSKKVFKSKYWKPILIILTIALLIRLFLTPHHHRFFIDESFYIGAAKNIADYFTSSISTGIYPKQIGWPVILTIPFWIFGASNYVAIYTSIFLGSISVVLMYFLVYLISNNKKIALISSLLLAILPLHIVYSGTAETITASIFFILATLISFIIMIKNQKKKLIFLTLFLFLFTIQIRVENILILIPMFIYIYINKIKLNLKNWSLPLIISLPIFISYLAQAYQLINFYEDSYTEITFFGLSGISLNLSLLTIVFIALAIIGSIILYSSNKKIFIFFSTWFLVYFAYYSFYQFSDDFHILPALVALIPIMAYTIYSVFNILPKKYNIIILIIVLLVFLLNFNNDPIPEFQLETQTLDKLRQDIPENCIVITDVPVIITSVAEISALDTVYFLRYTDEALAGYEDRCLLYYEGLYCEKGDWSKRSVDRCKTMHSKFNLDNIKKYEGIGLNYNLYKVSRKTLNTT
jgi:4-amino-4-deoxy-L-arabinose transferase-like glycosyltransferase